MHSFSRISERQNEYFILALFCLVGLFYPAMIILFFAIPADTLFLVISNFSFFKTTILPVYFFIILLYFIGACLGVAWGLPGGSEG